MATQQACDVLTNSPAQQSSETLADLYTAVRERTIALCKPLQTEDYSAQLTENASPPKWHLAHTSWFFETFILQQLGDYSSYNVAYKVLFNSYYKGVGRSWPREQRGHLFRPAVAEIMDYRAVIDANMLALLNRDIASNIRWLTLLGLHHEQQHQELLLADIKYNFGHSALLPSYQTSSSKQFALTDLQWISIDGGLKIIGSNPKTNLAYNDFVYDNETPQHQTWLEPYQLASRLVTNGEYLEFIADQGYQRPELWLADGWAHIKQTDGGCPLYWHPVDCPSEYQQQAVFIDKSKHPKDAFLEYSLAGLSELDPYAPVSHISLFEADAYARWKGVRLPTEAEWEVAAAQTCKPTLSTHPKQAAEARPEQMLGCLWQWTSSSYAPYPGFKPFSGNVGEYNGKFMCSQYVLRGSAWATPDGHSRLTYRNFFYPADRWQFSGIRLAKDSTAS